MFYHYLEAVVESGFVLVTRNLAAMKHIVRNRAETCPPSLSMTELRRGK